VDAGSIPAASIATPARPFSSHGTVVIAAAWPADRLTPAVEVVASLLGELAVAGPDAAF